MKRLLPPSLQHLKPPRVGRRDFGDHIIFLWRWMRNPRQMGALLPSSRALARLMASVMLPEAKEAVIVELGGGTGGLTDGLLRAGVALNNLYVVEIDPKLCAILRKKYPDACIIEGDAQCFDQLLPPALLGQVDVIISGMPILNFTMQTKYAIMEASFRVLKSGGEFLQFTYGPKSPWPAAELGLTPTRVGHTIRNFPPATIWRYIQSHSTPHFL